MPDGSTVRLEVAQYLVNKKLDQLRDNNVQLKISESALAHAFPLYGYGPESDAPEDDRDSPVEGIPPEPPLPSLPTPGKDVYSWEELLTLLSEMTSSQATFQAQQALTVADATDATDATDVTATEQTCPLPSWYRVCIIGAGVAGLRSAKLLQDMGIPYKILEASDRPGGRIFTYDFHPKDQEGKHDYYDVGAMRFPDNDANEITFKLFKELGLDTKLIKYVFSNPENIRFYNNIKKTEAEIHTAGDHFDDKNVPKEYHYKEVVNLSGQTVFGVSACTAEAYDPFRKALIDDPTKGWELLMTYDWASTRAYLTHKKPQYPLSVVHWMETRGSGTGGFDKAFSEEILESLVFDYPDYPKDPGNPKPRKEVQWWCLEGGTQVLVDGLLDALSVKPAYGHRVTKVQSEDASPNKCFPDLPSSPVWRKFPMMKVSVAGKQDECFTHVISTSTFANLGMIDTNKVAMACTQRQAIRSLGYGPAVKVAIRFKTRWWEQDGLKECGGSSYTDRPSRVIVYPSYGIGEDGPGVLMVSYNWHQDASRYGSLIERSNWSEKPPPDCERPPSEQILLDQIYSDLAVLHGKDIEQLRADTLDYHAFNWYHSPFTMGAFAAFGPGDFSTFFPEIVQPAGCGNFHFAGEVASAHHAWIAGALESAVRVVAEILRRDCPCKLPAFKEKHGLGDIFVNEEYAAAQCFKGLFSEQLEEALAVTPLP